jgi:hypothetical protein
MNTVPEPQPHPARHDHEVSIVIKSTRGSKEFRFALETKVQGVIETAVKAFGFANTDKFQLALESQPGEPLQPERTLVSYHVQNGTAFVLTGVGTGV